MDCSNPFSTRFVAPGAVNFLFPEGQNCQLLIERLRSNAWQGQIVGPHGSGKSALLRTLIPELERTGFCIRCFSLHDGQRALPDGWRAGFQPNQTARLLVVDGYEQLSRLATLRLNWFCRRQGAGLVVTSHKSAGLPDLFRTGPSLEMAWSVVEGLLPATGPRVDRVDVAQAFAECGGNMREVLFRLYDVYESRRRQKS